MRFVAQPILLAGFPIVVATAAQGNWPVSGWMTWLGDRSYSAYLFHFPVMALCWAAISKFVPMLFYIPSIWYGAVQAVVCVPVVWLLADMVFRRIERPFIRIGSAFVRSADTARADKVLDVLPSAAGS